MQLICDFDWIKEVTAYPKSGVCFITIWIF